MTDRAEVRLPTALSNCVDWMVHSPQPQSLETLFPVENSGLDQISSKEPRWDFPGWINFAICSPALQLYHLTPHPKLWSEITPGNLREKLLRKHQNLELVELTQELQIMLHHAENKNGHKRGIVQVLFKEEKLHVCRALCKNPVAEVSVSNIM